MQNQQKRKIFEQHLRAQENQRQAQVQKKKKAQQQKNNPQEDMLFIQKQFRNYLQDYEAKLQQLKKGQIQFRVIVELYEKMKSYYVDISYVLMTYDRQYYKQMLEKINNNIIQLKKKHQPKNKFKFSRRDQDFGVKNTSVVEEIKSNKNQQSAIPGVDGKQSQTLVLKGSDSGGSFKIVNCTSTNIDLLESTQILFLKNLKKCTIKAAITKSTVFVDNCVDCFFELNCHQLRIHNTFNTRFNIYVTSKAIIEDCKGVVFSPYTYQYEGRQQHQVQSDRKQRPNLWRQIQDFNWLKENEKSPHFELVQQ